MRIILIVLLSALTFSSFAKEPSHGEALKSDNGKLTIWSSTDKKWLDVESFWMAYAETGGGLTWGRSSEYPEYSKVQERDTFMVELEQGPCLMEFFHERWRRANDVVRWNDQLNDYAGCPYVFD